MPRIPRLPTPQSHLDAVARSTPVNRGRIGGGGVIVQDTVIGSGPSAGRRRTVTRAAVPGSGPPIGSIPKTLPQPTARGGGIAIVPPPAPTPFTPSRGPIGGTPTVPSNQFSPDSLGPVAAAGCEFLTGVARDLCLAGVGIFTGGSNPDPRGDGLRAGNCPDGYELNADGECVAKGLGGAMERFVPGGSPGQLTDDFGEAVVGGFGLVGIIPAQRGVTINRFGQSNPILRCPRGMVLGTDNVCYHKRSLPVRFRKWRPAKKPPISRKAWKALQDIDSVQNKVSAMVHMAGLKPVTRKKIAVKRKKK